MPRIFTIRAVLLRTESRCENFAGDFMPKPVPMSVAEVFAYAVEKYTLAGGIVSKRWCECYDADRIIRAKLMDPSIRIEKIVGTDPFRESLPGLDIGQRLWAGAPCDDDQPCSAAFNLVIYL